MITFKPNPFQSVNGEEEKEVKCGWHLSEWRVMRGNWWWFIYVCIGFVSFLCLWLYWMYLFDFDFSGDYVNELIEEWIATHRLSKCKSPHHDYRGICYLRWIMVVCSGLTVFNGAYPVRYECHESTVWVELQHVLLEPWIARRGKNRSCRCMLQWLWMGMCLNEWVADHMEREQTVNVDGIKRNVPWWDSNCK